MPCLVQRNPLSELRSRNRNSVESILLEVKQNDELYVVAVRYWVNRLQYCLNMGQGKHVGAIF